MRRDQNNPAYPTKPGQSSPATLTPHPKISNPVLTAADTGISGATDLADPFWVYDGGTYYVFFEILGNPNTPIAYATSHDGLSWTYQDTVLTGAEYSYPFVFKWQGQWYMFPHEQGTTTTDSQAILYSADSFPSSWSVEDVVLDVSYKIVDPTPVFWDGRWYLFVHNVDAEEKQLYYNSSDTIENSSWTEHPDSPLYTNSKFSRNGGRPTVYEDSFDLYCRSAAVDPPTRPRFQYCA